MARVACRGKILACQQEICHFGDVTLLSGSGSRYIEANEEIQDPFVHGQEIVDRIPR